MKSLPIRYREEFTNELGNQIVLTCTCRQKDVHIRIAGPESVGDWIITKQEAEMLIKALRAVL